MLYINDDYMIIYKISSPKLQFSKVDGQSLLFFPFSGTSHCQSAFTWLVLGLGPEFFYLGTHKLHYLIEVILEPVLKLLVVAAALIRGPFSEGLGEAVKYCRLSP